MNTAQKYTESDLQTAQEHLRRYRERKNQHGPALRKLESCVHLLELALAGDLSPDLEPRLLMLMRGNTK